MKAGGLRPDQVGKIILDDHSAIVAVPRDVLDGEADAPGLLERLAPCKLKNTRVRLSLLR